MGKFATEGRNMVVFSAISPCPLRGHTLEVPPFPEGKGILAI